MTLHLVKLCVGCDSVDDLIAWIGERKADRVKRGVVPDRIHRTRQSPKRAAEILDGGSLYWVIKGEIKVREAVLDLRAVTDDAGVSYCDIVLSGEPVAVAPRRLRPFQGWRYLPAHEAPRDMHSFGSGMQSLPPELARELSLLGLL